ncbi:MAG TPA: DsbA family protein, partial [Anaerolineae bacterium]|nr:DsbA family protein [Anaerolineae bacterium]
QHFFLFSFLVWAALLLAACDSSTTDKPAAVTDNQQAEIAKAVEATLTTVANGPAEKQPESNATPAPQAQTTAPGQTITLPPPVPNWQLVDKPIAQKGSADAPVIIVEYSDFQCPWCLRFHQQVMPKLEPLIEAGNVRFVYKHFPVLGNASVITSQAAECAGIQGNFWTLHDWLFDNQSTWKGKRDVRQVVLDAAAELGYDTTALSTCMDASSTLQAIRADYQETQRYGFRGTPSFVINGRLIPGFLPWERFGPLVEASLAEALGKPLPDGFVAAPRPDSSQPPPDADFEEEAFAVDGASDAPVTIVEFSDYQCPYCQRFYRETKPLLDERYITTGKVRFVYKDFPLDRIHPQARTAAEAAECAGAQGSYWPMHNRIFEGKAEWENQAQAADVFKGYAAELGLDTAAFNDCLDSGIYAAEVQADLEEGQRAGITGTPSFFINGRRLIGAQPFEAFVQIIEAALGE